MTLSREHRPDYTRLPEAVPAEQTIGSVDVRAVPDPHAERNVDQHVALRED